jgi:hypothetical protein
MANWGVTYLATDYALEPGNPHWPVGGVVTWYYAGTASIEFNRQAAAGYSTPDLFPAELAAAFSRWSQVANIHFQQTTNPAIANIKITWADIDGSFGILAQTNYSYNPSGGLFNSAQITFDDLELYNPTSGAELLASGVTFESVALHEIGHALGLAHYDSAPAIMNAFAHATVKDLTQSDIDGILAIYGPSTASPTIAIAKIQSDYLAITRTTLSLTEATTITNSINAGRTTESAYVKSLLVQVENTTIPAVAVEASMYGVTGTSAEITKLVTQFLPSQITNAVKNGYNPLVYASEALGLVFAFGDENGGQGFSTNFGPSKSSMPNTKAGDAAFAVAAASTIFGSSASANTSGAIETFVINWKAFFTSHGVVGIPNATPDQIDLAARGAAWGDAVGIALANNLGLLPGQVTNFLEDAAQGTAVYAASLASQPIATAFLSAPIGVQLVGAAALVDHHLIA